MFYMSTGDRNRLFTSIKVCAVLIAIMVLISSIRAFLVTAGSWGGGGVVGLGLELELDPPPNPPKNDIPLC
jgi:hypothetical protein